tara:strand:- start:25486 stop:27072 length:1587 start_codon:yes stop_codon:yes gene_type:complete
MMRFFRRKPAAITARDVLEQILEACPQATALAPKDCRGVYGLIDHHGDLRYIGSTKSAAETLYKRIHQRHRTGSETSSHYFSRMYNTGRMWRLRNDPVTKVDGDIAKKLRNAFIGEYCQAVWVPLSDDLDISALEAEVISLAPKEVVAWNGRGMEAYEEPTDLVDAVIDRLKFGTAELAAIERQKTRFFGGSTPVISKPPIEKPSIPAFPKGPFRFVALDVETANHDRASICQIGVACVRPDNSIETWVTYVDPQTSHWVFTGLHGIDNKMVLGGPTFAEVLPVLEECIGRVEVYQHSGFDRSAIRAATSMLGRSEPEWVWQNSVTVARRAWPELKGNGGHGLASLKNHLGLSFNHHDAGEDARAAAEVVLHAEASQGGTLSRMIKDDEDFDVIEASPSVEFPRSQIERPSIAPAPRASEPQNWELIGISILTQGNINNNHFYLRDVWTAFPADCIGGSNIGAAAVRSVTVSWGADLAETTDIDGQKKLFRRRGWVREFFKQNNAQAGDRVRIYRKNPYEFMVSIEKI